MDEMISEKEEDLETQEILAKVLIVNRQVAIAAEVQNLALQEMFNPTRWNVSESKWDEPTAFGPVI